MENAGVWTWLTLEGNENDEEEMDEDVVKYWPIYPTKNMSLEE
jgi:hypothetical protein